MSLRYYRIQVRRMTVGECRRLTTDGVTFLAALAAKFGLPNLVRMPPAVVLTHWPTVPADDLPAGVLDQMRPAVAALTADGFRALGYGRFPLRERNRDIATALLLSADRLVGADVCRLRVGAGSVVLVSATIRFRDGTFGSTLTTNSCFDPPPGVQFRLHPGLPADRLLAQHREHLAGWEADGRFPVPYADADGPAAAVELGRLMADELIERGVYEPMSDEEVEDYLDAGG